MALSSRWNEVSKLSKLVCSHTFHGWRNQQIRRNAELKTTIETAIGLSRSRNKIKQNDDQMDDTVDIRSRAVWPEYFHRFNELVNQRKVFLRTDAECVYHLTGKSNDTRKYTRIVVMIVLHMFSRSTSKENFSSFVLHLSILLPSGFFKLQTGKT